MPCYFTPDGEYYVGLYVAEGSIEVPERPSPGHEYIDGVWVLVHPTHAELKLKVLTDARTLRADLLELADGLQASALTLGSTDATALETYKEGLRNITLTDLSGATTEAQMRAIISAAYKALKDALPNSVKLKFYQTLQ